MAEAINVTREIVQELAETGAVQLRDLNLDALPAHYPSAGRVFRDPDSQSLEDCSEVGATLTQLTAHIMRLSGQDQLNPAVRLLKFKSELETKVHQDAKGTLRGITFLWVPKANSSGDQTLEVYGRSCRPTELARQRYQYEDGLIILAQQNFGLKILEPDSNLESTWHKGQRRDHSKICIADIKI